MTKAPRLTVAGRRGFTAFLRREGGDAVAYHAGPDEEAKSRAKDAWMSSAVRWSWRPWRSGWGSTGATLDTARAEA